MTDYRSRLKTSGKASRGFKRNIERKLCSWLNTQYGCSIDADDRTTLVAALSDGVILCKLIRDLSGNRRIKFKAKRPNIFQKNENIRTFSQQCTKMGISDVATLAPSDLRDGATKKVMACLMHLYRQSKDWTAKDGTKENPGVVKMVLVKPKRAKVEIVTDYLSQLKAVRRNRLANAGVVASITFPSVVSDSSSATAEAKLFESADPLEQSKTSVDAPETLIDAKVVPGGGESHESNAAKSLEHTPDELNNNTEEPEKSTRISDAQAKVEPVKADNQSGQKQGITKKEPPAHDVAAVACPGSDNQLTPTTADSEVARDGGSGGGEIEIDADVLLVRLQELKLECSRLQRLGVRSAAQIADLEAEKESLKAAAANERQQRLELQHDIEVLREAHEKELTHKRNNQGELSAADSSNDMATTSLTEAVDQSNETLTTEPPTSVVAATDTHPTVAIIDRSDGQVQDTNALGDGDDEDDEESIDYGLGDEDEEVEEEEEEEEVDELEINVAAEKQLNAVMESAKQEVDALKAECAGLRAKYAAAQQEARATGDQALAQESKKQMTQYVQLLSKLQHREAEFDELQLDRAELRRLRREAEARLSSTTQQYEEVKTQLDSAESSKQELHERCHSAEEALRFANTRVAMLEGQLGTVSTELKQLRADQKAQKREIRKVAAAAANEEIRAQTERFEAKLRAKDAKVKDARKKAKAAVREATEAQRICKAEVQSLSLKLQQARQQLSKQPPSVDQEIGATSLATPASSSGGTKSAAAEKESLHQGPSDQLKTPAAPMESFFAEEKAQLSARAEAAVREAAALRKELTEKEAQSLAAAQAVAEITRKQHRTLRLDLHAAQSALEVAKAELRVHGVTNNKNNNNNNNNNASTNEDADAAPSSSGGAEGGNNTETDDELLLLRHEVVQLKRAAAQAERTFLHTVLTNDDKYARLHDQFVELQHEKAAVVAEAARTNADYETDIRLLRRRVAANEKELLVAERAQQDTAAVSDTERTKAQISANVAAEQIASLKADLAVCLQPIEDSELEGDAIESIESIEQGKRTLMDMRQRVSKANKVAARAREELDACAGQCAKLRLEVESLRAELSQADRRAIRALDDLSAEATAAKQRDASALTAEAASAARVEELQLELTRAGERSQTARREYTLQLKHAALNIQHLQKELQESETTAGPRSVDRQLPESSDTDAQDEKNGQVVTRTDDTVEAPGNLISDLRLEVRQLRAQVLAHERQDEVLAGQRDELEALVEANASKEELLKRLREDVASLRDDRDAALDEMTSNSLESEREVGNAGQKALKSATAARKKLSASAARVATLEEELRAAQSSSSLLQKRLDLFHHVIDTGGSESPTTAVASLGDPQSTLTQLQTLNKSLVGEVALLSKEVASLRLQGVSSEARAARATSELARAEQKEAAALELLQQARRLGQREKAAAALQEKQLREELDTAQATTADIHRAFDERAAEMKARVLRADSKRQAAVRMTQTLQERLKSQLEVAHALAEQNTETSLPATSRKQDSGLDGDGLALRKETIDVELRQAVAQLRADNRVLESSVSKLESELDALNEAQVSTNQAQTKRMALNTEKHQAVIAAKEKAIETLRMEICEAESEESTLSLELHELRRRAQEAEAKVAAVMADAQATASEKELDAAEAIKSCELLEKRLEAQQQRFDAAAAVAAAARSGEANDPAEFAAAAFDAGVAYEQELNDILEQLQAERAAKVAAMKDLIQANVQTQRAASVAQAQEQRLAAANDQCKMLQDQIAKGFIQAKELKQKEWMAHRRTQDQAAAEHRKHRGHGQEKEAASGSRKTVDVGDNDDHFYATTVFDGGNVSVEANDHGPASAAVNDDEDDDSFWNSPAATPRHGSSRDDESNLQESLATAHERALHFEQVAAEAQEAALKEATRHQQREKILREELLRVQAQQNEVQSKLAGELASVQVDLAQMRASAAEATATASLHRSVPSGERTAGSVATTAGSESTTDSSLTGARESLLDALRASARTIAEQSGEIAALLAAESDLRKDLALATASSHSTGETDDAADFWASPQAKSSHSSALLAADAADMRLRAGLATLETVTAKYNDAQEHIKFLKAKLQALKIDREQNPVELDGNANVCNHMPVLEVAQKQLEKALASAAQARDAHLQQVSSCAERVQAAAAAVSTAETERDELKLKLVDERQRAGVTEADMYGEIRSLTIRNSALQRQVDTLLSEQQTSPGGSMPLPNLDDLPFDVALPGLDSEAGTSAGNNLPPPGQNEQRPVPPPPACFEESNATSLDDSSTAGRVYAESLELRVVELETLNKKLLVNEQASREKLEVLQQARNASATSGTQHGPAKDAPASWYQAASTEEEGKERESAESFVGRLKQLLNKESWSLFRKASSAFRKGSGKMPAATYAQLFVEILRGVDVDPSTMVPGLLFLVIDDEAQRQALRDEFIALMDLGSRSLANSGEDSHDAAAVPCTTSIASPSGTVQDNQLEIEALRARVHELELQTQAAGRLQNDSCDNESVSVEHLTSLQQRVEQLEVENRELRAAAGDETGVNGSGDNLQSEVDSEEALQRLQELEHELETQRRAFDLAASSHAREAAVLNEDVEAARESARDLQNALADLSDQAQNASSAQRMEAEREAAAMRAALEAQLQSEMELSHELAEHEAAHKALAAQNATRESGFEAEAMAIRSQMQAKLDAVSEATEATAIRLASEQINNVRAEAQKNDAVNFEVQRQLNEKLALLSGTEEDKARRLQQLAATCQDLRSTESELRQLLENERERNAELLQAIDDQDVKAKLAAEAATPAPRPLTDEEKALAAEMQRLRPLSDTVRQFLASVGGPGFDLADFQRLPPWDGFVVETGEGEVVADEGGKASTADPDNSTTADCESGGTGLAIRSISLGGMRLRGVLPQKFFATPSEEGDGGNEEGSEEELDLESAQRLLRLTTLALGNNRLEGRVPRQLLRALHPQELRFLELNDNSFVGKIPTEIGAFVNLLELKLQYNKLTGLVPTEIGELVQLQRLNLGRNSLSGALPSELGRLSQLRIAEFHNNRITGVPAEHWGQLKRLTELKLQGNQIRDTSSTRAELKANLGPMCYVVI